LPSDSPLKKNHTYFCSFSCQIDLLNKIIYYTHLY